MKLVEVLSERKTDDLSLKFHALLLKIEAAAVIHLKEINKSLPDFDIHDEDHSQIVLQNIEILSASKMTELSSAELFMLHLAPFLHDIGMAPPQWEVNTFEAVEESESPVPDQDGWPQLLSNATFAECHKYIIENKLRIYQDFAKVSDFFFSFSTEESFVDYLANQLHAYQHFRYGNSDTIKGLTGRALKSQSRQIRSDFIRETHHTRSEQFVKNLKRLAESDLGGRWGEQLFVDLSKICRAHGEPFGYVETLDLNSHYVKENKANLQFIAMLLRIGDVMHFNFERAPKSLFTQRMIDSTVSQEHWIVKFSSGVNSTIEKRGTTGRQSIVYTAYCEHPKAYYFLNDYLDYVDQELANYEKFLTKIKFDLRFSDVLEKYELFLPQKVLRDDIKCDVDTFRPAPNLKFTLEQKQIIKLLMGVNLYKDKNLFLRELYQNSLDSCRVLLSKSIILQGKIIFGIKNEFCPEKGSRHIYCQDNGTGMTEAIIENYLLKIGKSYYNSRDFLSENISSNKFEPVSQFGIGLLSCFMIGDRVEIITKAIDQEPICFEIDGPSEYFYYKKASQVDLERLGAHGTIIKVFFNEANSQSFSNVNFTNVRSRLYIEKRLRHSKRKDEWDSNIYHILYEIIGDSPENVEILVDLQGTLTKLLPHDNAQDLSKFTANERSEIIDFIQKNDVPFRDQKVENYFEFSHCLTTVKKKLRFDGFEITWLLTLPQRSFPELTAEHLRINSGHFDGIVLVDGIRTNDRTNKFDTWSRIHNVQVNILGMKPELSIDRQNIVRIPDQLMRSYEMIPEVIVEDILTEINHHLDNFGLLGDEEIKNMLLGHTVNTYGFILPCIFKTKDKDLLSVFRFDTIGFKYGSDVTIAGFIDTQKLSFSVADFQFRDFSSFQKFALWSKAVDSEEIRIEDEEIKLTTKSGLFELGRAVDQRDLEHFTIFIKVDKWPAALGEYDISTGLFPFVPAQLFEKLKYESEGSQLTSRSALFHTFGNTLTALTALDPFQIDPRLGISEIEKGGFGKKEKSRVRRFGKFKDNIWFPELIGHSWESRPQNTKKDFFIFCFIDPVPMTPQERRELEHYSESEPEYYKGVTTGWSILFFGGSDHFVIVAGQANRMELVAKINPEFWEEFSEYEFSFLDGTKVVKD